MSKAKPWESVYADLPRKPLRGKIVPFRARKTVIITRFATGAPLDEEIAPHDLDEALDDLTVFLRQHRFFTTNMTMVQRGLSVSFRTPRDAAKFRIFYSGECVPAGG